jgi:glycosyltransferase involved in cell wall biosynthesis
MDRVARECAGEINRGRFDVLFGNSCGFQAVGPVSRYVTGPRVLYLGEPCRGLYEAMPRPPFAAPDPSGRPRWSCRSLVNTAADLIYTQSLRLRVREEYRNAHHYTRVLVNSLYSRESVLRAYGRDAHVCYLGIDTDLFRPRDGERERFVVGLGSFGRHKGVDRAVRALGTMPAGRRPQLVWVGNAADPGYRDEVERLAKSLGVELDLRMQITDQELVDTLGRATAMIYTSRLEPFGFAPLEANACGAPVVAIAEGGVREVVRAGVNGALVENDDPAALGEALLGLIERPNEARALGASAHRYVLDYWGLDKAVDRLERHLAAVAKGGGGPST